MTVSITAKERKAIAAIDDIISKVEEAMTYRRNNKCSTFLEKLLYTHFRLFL
jgi:hypothetical protein